MFNETYHLFLQFVAEGSFTFLVQDSGSTREQRATSYDSKFWGISCCQVKNKKIIKKCPDKHA